METTIPEQLAALSHPKRLDLFRLLMRRYPDSVAAGQIAGALGLKANTTSAYLATLRQAGLIEQNRVATSLHYSTNLPQIRGLFGGLMADCCQNRPDLCLPSFDAAATAAPGRPDKMLNVLFLCTGNSARSIIAEAILRTEGAGRFAAFSAGTRPAVAPHAQVLKMLTDKSHDISALSSKSLNLFDAANAPQMDFVITVCDAAANEECPIWPGHPMSAHWGLPDPVGAGRTMHDIEAAYNLLHARIRAFVALPVEQLTPISLQHSIDDIGRMQHQDTPIPDGAMT